MVIHGLFQIVAPTLKFEGMHLHIKKSWVFEGMHLHIKKSWVFIFQGGEAVILCFCHKKIDLMMQCLFMGG